MVQNERECALFLLLEMEQKNSYSNLLLKQKLPKNDPRFSARVTALVYGVLERKLTLEHLARFYTKGGKKLDREVVWILQIGFYQLLYQNIPENAAVNETVKLCQAVKKSSARGLVNAVLRRFLRDEKDLHLPKDALKANSIRYSCPEELIRRWRKAYGPEEAQKILEYSFGPAVLYVRVHSGKITREALASKLASVGVQTKEVPYFPNALALIHPGNIEQLPGYREGEFYVQDLSSQLCAEVSGVQPGDRVYDLCAAPGSKSFTMALFMKNEGYIGSYDQYDHKIRLMEEGRDRLGLSVIHPSLGDALVYQPDRPKAEVVLCDVPCGGLGILRRKPEIKYKNLAEVDSLSQIQSEILETGSRYVKEGGRLIYSTCSLNPVENEEVAETFLRNHPFFRPAKLPEWLEGLVRIRGSMVTVFPYQFNSDGFFFAVFEKKSENREEK